MGASFIKPQTKHIFAKITKIWFFYFVLSAVLLVGYYVFLEQAIKTSLHHSEQYQAQQKALQQKIKLADTYFERLAYETSLVNQRLDKNQMREDKIKDLLELIPDKITINFVEFTDTTLVLKGVTPSKEFFYFGLQDPLKANFGKSSVSFYALANGWYQFISISHTYSDSTSQAPKAAQ